MSPRPEIARRFALLLCLLPISIQAAEKPPVLDVQFTPAGLSSVRHAGVEILAAGGGPEVNGVAFSGTRPDRKQLAPTAARFDPTTRALTLTYDWGKVVCTYAVSAHRLDFFIEVTNTSAAVIDSLNLTLVRLVLQQDRMNNGSVDNDRVLAVKLLRDAAGLVGLGNWEAKRPVTLSIVPPRGRGASADIRLIVPAPAQSHHPVVDARFFAQPGRPIPAGASDHYHVSLAFGPARFEDFTTGLRALCPDLFAHFRAERPMTLKWPDRRTIGTVFLANPMTGWKNNPRGYLFGKGKDNNVNTKEGMEAFRRGLMEYADRCVRILREMDAQGVIVWDLEGAQYWHPITYIGDPRALPRIAPEMDQCADAFFKKFTDAGLRVGLTIRPTEIFYREKERWPWWHRDVKDPLELLSEKIVYVQKRWGCTLFYMDSNVFGSGWGIKVTDRRVPWVMPTAIVEALHKRHPDVLVIPEWENAAYYAYSAPYQSSNLRQMSSNHAVQAVYPRAFSIVSTSANLLEQHWDTYLTTVLSGDVLLCTAWYPSAENAAAKLIYLEAEWRRKGVPPAVQGADLHKLSALAKDPAPYVRYYAARALGQCGDVGAAAPLGALLDDPDTLVRKSAVIALGQLKGLKDPGLVARLAQMLRDAGSRRGAKPVARLLRPFLAGALASIGGPAVPVLIEMAGGADTQLRPDAIRALGASRTPDPKAAALLLDLLGKNEKNVQLKEQIARALGQLHAKDAVEPLIALLADKDERVCQAAVIALGEIGDRRAVKPLIKLFDRPFRTVVVYNIRYQTDDALRRITGQKDLSGKKAWQAWLQQK